MEPYVQKFYVNIGQPDKFWIEINDTIECMKQAESSAEFRNYLFTMKWLVKPSRGNEIKKQMVVPQDLLQAKSYILYLCEQSNWYELNIVIDCLLSLFKPRHQK
jgi:hypothetical protein